MIDELTDKSKTKSRIIEGLYILSIANYATLSQLKICKKQSLHIHIFTKKFLQQLTDKGIIENNSSVYSPTENTIQALKPYKPIHHLRKRLRGDFGPHQEKLTDVLMNFTNDPLFFTVCYPTFDTSKGLLIPDALLVLKDNDRYQLNFIEVENPKVNWKEHLGEKKDKYEALGREDVVYNYWKHQAKLFKLRIPSRDEFCFQIMVFGIELDFGEGWLWQV
jgi:hypothetical protein